MLPNDLGDNSFNFKFTDEGYGDIGYNIYNFHRDLTSGQYVYTKVSEILVDMKYKFELEYFCLNIKR